jgi:drug/metabolite transporter (DMT)-like permease
VSPRTAGLTALAMGAFAANSLLCRAALASGAADALTFTSVRMTTGAVVLGLLARGRRPAAPGAGRLASAAALFAYALAFSVAYTRIPAAVGALALFGAVQATMIGWGLRSGERPGAGEWLGLALSLCGLAALALPGLAAPDPLGTGLMIAAGAAWGVYSLRGRASREPLAANAAAFAGTVPLALAASALGLWAGPPRVTIAGLGLATASGAAASGLGYAVWYAALRGLTATQAAVVQLSVPPLAAAGGVVLLGETLSDRLVLCGLAILGGVALALGSRRPPSSS